MYALIDASRMISTNVDVNVSSSAGDTTQNGRTAAMTSNAETEVPSSDQGICSRLCIDSGYLYLRSIDCGL